MTRGFYGGSARLVECSIVESNEYWNYPLSAGPPVR